jgi:Ca2+/H+ antiporter
MPDYTLGEKLGPAGSLIAIVMGTLLAFALMLGISKLLAARKKQKQPQVNQ